MTNCLPISEQSRMKNPTNHIYKLSVTSEFLICKTAFKFEPEASFVSHAIQFFLFFGSIFLLLFVCLFFFVLFLFSTYQADFESKFLSKVLHCCSFNYLAPVDTNNR